MLSCVRWRAKPSEFFKCHPGVKQGCLLSLLIFFLLIWEVAAFVRKNGKHGAELIPDLEIFLLLFADDIVLISSTPAGLQNQINNLENTSNSLGLIVIIETKTVMVFRNGGHIAAYNINIIYSSTEIEIIN